MKLVSIVIPVYNTGALLYRCFDSLVHQTSGIDCLDIVVVDDGSTDGISPGIIREYVDKYPGVFRCVTKENGGQGSARNMAFPLCTGKYVTCLDSDDTFYPEWISIMTEAAEKNKADFVGCAYDVVSYDGDNTKILRDYTMRPICNNNREMFIDADVCMFTILLTRSVLEESGARYPEGYIYEDMAFYIELLPWIRHPVYIEKTLSSYTLHTGSTMTTITAERVSNVFGMFDSLIRFYRKKGLYEAYKAELEYFIGKVLLFSSLNRAGMVRGIKHRRRLVDRTYDYLQENIPDVRQNRYASGAKGLYMHHYTKLLMMLVTELLHIRFLIIRDYNI